MDHDAPIRVLYIAGWQRSGSTILANILGQVDGFVSTGELYYLWDYVWSRNVLCGCGRRFHDCPLWSTVVCAAFGGSERVDVEAMRRAAQALGRTRGMARYLLRSARRRIEAREGGYLEHLGRLYAAIAGATGGARIVDSSKWPSYGRLLQMVPGLDVKVVHLVRDPRAVAHSWLRRTPLADREPPDEMHRTPVDSALHWTAWNAAAELYWGRDALRLRYEDFVRWPAASVGRILEFVGEAARVIPFASAHAIDLRPTHTVSGNPVRLRSGRVELVEDDEWRSRLCWRDHALVTALTFPLLARYGYLGNRWARANRRPPAARAAVAGELAVESAEVAPALARLAEGLETGELVEGRERP